MLSPNSRSMKRHWIPRTVNSLYRREPISSFLLTVGAVDAVIGGVGDRGSLLALGLGTLGVAIALRIWLRRKPPKIDMGDFHESRPPMRYLPSASSRPSLPVLDISDRKPSPRSHQG